VLIDASKTSIVFPDNAPCPCSSGKTVRECRCRHRHFVPLPVNTRPRGIVTGLRVRKCYAQATGDCRPPISADHAIAEAISDDFQRTPVTRILSDGTSRIVPSSAVGRNVLCRRHNSALSPLDDLGRRFVRALTQQLKHRFENSSQDTHALFNGADVERWMLKVLCTMAHGERASRVHSSSTWRVPRAWLRILFEGRPLPPGAGLYTPRVARGRFDRGILTFKIVGQLRPLETGALILGGRDHAVLGISMCIYGQDFDLHMFPPSEESQYWYRIRMYRMRSAAGGVSHVHLGWEEAPPSFRGEAAGVDRENAQDDPLR
jgi:hypothetical protein